MTKEEIIQESIDRFYELKDKFVPPIERNNRYWSTHYLVRGIPTQVTFDDLSDKVTIEIPFHGGDCGVYYKTVEIDGNT